MTLGLGNTGSSRRGRRSSKGLRLALLVVGLTMLVIGVLFLAAYLHGGNHRLKLFGIIYILTAVVMIAGQEIIGEMRKARRRRHRQEADPNGLRP